MIRLENVTKTFVTNGISNTILNGATMTFPTGRSVGLLGRNGAGKSSLLRLIAGTLDPTSGEIIHEGTVSWPVGFAGSFHPDLSGLQNIRFVGRVYGVDTDELVDFVEDFAELGKHFYLPCRTYSSGMKSRLAFGLSMGIRFDTYLVDEVTSVGDAAFRQKSEAVFKERMRYSGALLVSHGTNMLRRNCDAGVVLNDGELTWYDDIAEAIAVHESNMDAATIDEDL
ncbi:ABC transporter ATP-binding protein [Pseudaestuariivita atlantica]|uniref:ABC transporter ATP-binding protein n=1 Tax=Pseudaestuariivita atlantica TaxID=1317121 RepID=A0A0L1JLF6_9RHOB|nr:ABC transporter ATP-binding protein [Pseudaestuariivita atlantica]KNG92248.1 ABC transporter ATP-binding protein [Pseudaestuariivita atlantica]